MSGIGNRSRRDLERSRRAYEEDWLQLFPVLLASAYAAYEREGRGAIYVPMLERTCDPGHEPLYVQAAEVLRHVIRPSLLEDLETYDPHTEAIVIFAYPESVYVRRRCGVDILSGERLTVGQHERE